MGIKFSVGVSEASEDRELLEALRRKAPTRGQADDEEHETRAAGWPLRASAEDEPEAGQSPWAW